MNNIKITIIPIPILKDNYTWILISDESAIVVDPGDAQPILDFFKLKKLRLKAILITHHHYDHVGGVPELVKKTHTPVYAPSSEKISFTTLQVQENEKLLINGFPPFSILSIPGHTLDHVAYYFENHLFCGDTLFSAGCGRVFEGTHEQMYHSLEKLKALPKDTNIYCAHEYTLQNLYFAQAVEADNEYIHNKIDQVKELIENKIPSLPTQLEEELKINPFLRCDVSTVIASAEKHAGKPMGDAISVFSTLRQWKNNFTS